MNSQLSASQLTSYLHPIFVSTEKEGIEKEIQQNPESWKALTVFVNFVLSNNAKELQKQFPKFQNNPTLSKLQFFKNNDINALIKREEVTVKYFDKLYLLENNENINEAYKKCIEKIQKKTSRPPYFNARNECNETPLAQAINNKNIQHALILLDEESIFLEAKSGLLLKTALEIALQVNHKKLVKKILSLQKRISWPKLEADHHLINCMHQNSSEINTKIISLLLENKASVHIQPTSNSVIFAINTGNVEALKLFYKYNPNIFSSKSIFDELCENLNYYTDESFYSLLEFLDSNNKLRPVMDLVISSLNETGQTLFSKLASEEKTLLESLKEEITFLNMQDKEGNTLLMLAIKNKFIKSSKFLIDQNANLLIRNNHKRTAIDQMILCDQIDLLDYTIEKRIFPETKNDLSHPLREYLCGIAIMMIEYNHNKVISCLKENKYAQKLFEQFGFFSEFVELAIDGKIEKLKLLRDSFNIPLALPNPKEWNPYHCALLGSLIHGQMKTADALIKLGATYNDIAQNGSTRLHYLIEIQNPIAPAFLLKQENIDINIKNNHGQTPLVLALGMEYFDLAAQLIEKDNSILTDQEKLKVLLLQVIKMKSWKAFQFILKYGSQNHELWKNVFESIKKEDSYPQNKVFAAQGFLECCELRSQFFELIKKHNMTDIQNEYWENKLDQLLKMKNQKAIEKQLKECRKFLKKVKTSLSHLKNIKPQTEQISTRVKEIANSFQNTMNDIIEKTKRNIFEQNNIDSMQNLCEEVEKEVENTDRLHKDELEKIFLQKKEVIEENSRSKDIDQEKKIEMLYKQIAELEKAQQQLQEQNRQQFEWFKEKERRLLEKNKQQKKQIITLSNIVDNKKIQKDSSVILETISIENNNSSNGEKTICKFIEPKNNSLISLIDCIAANCDLLIEQKKTDLDFANIKNRATSPLKTREDLENLCSVAGFLRPSNSGGGSHAKWKCIYSDIDFANLSTHEGNDNDEGQKKSVLNLILEVLKKQFQPIRIN